jgi:hypothetical protein
MGSILYIVYSTFGIYAAHIWKTALLLVALPEEVLCPPLAQWNEPKVLLKL